MIKKTKNGKWSVNVTLGKKLAIPTISTLSISTLRQKPRIMSVLCLCKRRPLNLRKNQDRRVYGFATRTTEPKGIVRAKASIGQRSLTALPDKNEGEKVLLLAYES